MPFGSTITVTVNAIAKVMNRINDSEPFSSTYLLRGTTDEYRLTIRHSNSNRKGINSLLRGVDRHNLEMTHTIFATATLPEYVRKMYTVFEVSPGDDQTAAYQDFKGFFTYQASDPPLTDMVNWLS